MSPAPGGAQRAAFALALALAVSALAREPRPAPCAAPRERAAAGSWSVEVACAGPGHELRGPARLLFERGIDPNRADLATLAALPGIGPGRAAALAEERVRSPFCSAIELERVKGIGPKIREKMERLLAFEPISGCGPPP